MASEEDQNMDDILYKAARDGATIPSEVNFHSRTLGDGNNVLHVAAQHGNHEFIAKALDQLPEHHYQYLCQQNSNGETPLHLAAEFGDLKTVQVLLDANFNTKDLGDRKVCWRERDHQGDTPLHKALKHGHDGIAMEMLNTNTERSFAGGSFNSLVSDLSVEGNSLAYLAAENYCFKFLRKLLEECDPNVVSLSGYKRQTVFHSVARSSKKDLMSELINTIREPLLKEGDDFGKTALHYAVEENRSVMVEELLRADSSLAYLLDNGGLTPLHIAFEEGLSPIVKIILELSPQSVETRGNHGRTPLHYAKMDGDFLEECRTTIEGRILRLLINRVDDDGNTPLHVALLNSKPDSAYQLLHFSGCNSMLRNNEGNTPWDLCKSNDNIPSTTQVYMDLRRDWTSTKKRRDWAAPYTPSSHSNMIMKDEERLLDKIGVAAALLLPLNFAAAFSIPGGYDNTTGWPILRDHHNFHVYSIANMIAFLATVLILVGCTFGIGKRVNKKQLAKLNIFLLQVALFTTVIAYVGGIFAIGDLGRDYKARLPIILLSLGVGIVSSLLVVNWFD